MIVFNNVPKGYDKPVLTVVVFHYIRGAGDSCSYSAEYKSIHTVESLKPGQRLFTGKDEWAYVKILSIGDEEIEVLWRDRKKVVVKYEDMNSCGMGPDVETVWCEEYYNFKIFYDSDSDCGTIWKKFDGVREKHRLLGEEGRIKRGRDEDSIIIDIDELNDVYGGKYGRSQAVEVLKKLLLTANNWWTFEMSTEDVNRTGLLYDICRFYSDRADSPEENYLSEKDELGWRVIAWMFENNDPAKLIIDRETFADRLAKAAVNGNKHAVAIFDKYAESLKKLSMADYAYLMIAYKTLIVDREDYPIIEKTVITPLPEQPCYDIKEPERPDLGHDIGKIIARLYEIRDISKANYDAEKQWRNVPLFKEAFDYRDVIPDVLPGYFETAADKADLYYDLIGYVFAYDAPRLSLQARDYIASLYGKCLDYIYLQRRFDDPESDEAKAFRKTKENFEDNSKVLRKRMEYLDENVSINEFCEKYNVEDRYDAVELTEEFEKYSYVVQEEVEQRLSLLSLNGNTRYAFSLLERARVLRKYGIEWQDELQVNHEKKTFYFGFNIQGEDYVADNIYHYGLMAAISKLEDCDSKDYLNHLATAYANMVHWMNNDEYLDTEAMKKHIKALRKDVDDVEKGKNFGSPARMYVFGMLDDVHELASQAKYNRYDVEHPDPEKQLEDEWNELCVEIEELCSEGKDRDDSKVGEMMARAEAQCSELIDTYKRDDLLIHYAFLRCCDDWYSRVVVRHEEFRNRVREAINNYEGLSIDNKRNWFIIEQLLLDNTVEHVIPDFEVMETLIKEAIDEGDDEIKGWAEEIQEKIKEYIAANKPKQKERVEMKLRELSDAEIEEHDRILEHVVKKISDISAIYEQSPSGGNEGTAKMKQEVFEDFNRLINDFGRFNLFIYRAALEACNDWKTFVLARESSFKMDVEKGINEYGSLGPGCTIDWRIMCLLSINNDIDKLMDDLGLLRELLLVAVRDGNAKVKSYAVNILDKGKKTMSFGGLTDSDDNKNVVPNGYTYEIGARYVTVYNEKLASPYFDIRCLEARNSQDSFVETIVSAIRGLIAVGKQYNIMEDPTLLKGLETLIAAHKQVEGDGSKIEEARQSVYAISGEFQDLADFVDSIDRYAPQS